MSVLGIVAEYNPFHNGHLYHLRESKALTGADYAVCVMSGNFVQRGGPAFIDKWSRTEIALKCGIDLVIELPVVYAMSSAEYFAYGGVKLLDSLGIVDYISFGSETGNLDVLRTIAGILNEEPEEYRQILKKALDTGISFPSAREKAICEYIKKNRGEEICNGISDNGEINCDSFENAIRSPNNILAIEYLKALEKIGSPIKPVIIQRTGSTYNSTVLQGTISSAMSIRTHFRNNKSLKAIADTVPPECLEILRREVEAGRGPVFAEDFSGILLSHLRLMNTDEISRLPYISEGLENRIKSASESAGTIDDLIDRISTRRYPGTRVARSLFHILTGLRKDRLQSFKEAGGPQYIRILGFSSKGKHLLSQISKTAKLPLIVKTADYKSIAARSESPSLFTSMFEHESASSDQYVLAFRNHSERCSGREFTHPVVIIQG